jgi:hypothetical protein
MDELDEETLDELAETLIESDEWLTEATKIFGPDISWEEIKRLEDAELRTWQGDLHYLGTALTQLKLVGSSHNHVADLLLPDALEEGEDQWSITEQDREKLEQALSLIDEVYENIEDDVASRVED